MRTRDACGRARFGPIVAVLVVALATSGCTLWGFGANADRQLGDGTGIARSSPVQIDDADWRSVAGGQVHSCGIHSDWTLWCWGTNAQGEVGDGTKVTRTRPVQIGNDEWKVVSVGNVHSCGLKADSTLWCWGGNANGQLGNGMLGSQVAPVRVGNATWKSVSAGGRHTCAVDAGDAAWCWGANAQGQLGDGTLTARREPVAITGARWVEVSSGDSHSCGIRTNATLWCWGADDDGQLGAGAGEDATRPVAVDTAQWLVLSVGAFHTCGIRTNGSLWCWGKNNFGQLGIGALPADRPAQVSFGLDTYTAVAAGGSHTCAIRRDTTLWCWGRNSNGQLGTGTQAASWFPTQVGTQGQWAAIDAGALHTHALQRASESTSPDFAALQGYRLPAPTGLDFAFASSVPGGNGGRVRIVDLEYNWNFAHEDLDKARAPGALVPHGTFAPRFDTHHGTAVLGVLVGDANSFGVTGMVPATEVRMVPAMDGDFYELADAIDLARQNLSAGDVLLIEQQAPGPHGCDDSTQAGCVPVEWDPAYYDAIVAATAAGIVVVEAAGNGAENLGNASLYGSPFPAGRPDSGAIIVGAGGAEGCGVYGRPPRSRLGYSTYGPRVNVHAWGECVVTAGYGGLFGSELDKLYTGSFDGTSSASAIVAAAAAAVSSAREEAGLPRLTSRQMRDLLVATGSPQDTSSPNALPGRIGPMPNLAAALDAIAAESLPAPSPDAAARERRTSPKPAHTVIPGGYSRTSIVVKLVEGADVELANGQFTSPSGLDVTGLNDVLANAPVTSLSSLFSTPADTLRSQTDALEQSSGRPVADLHLYYRVAVQPGAHTEAVIDALNALSTVELAAPEPRPAAPPIAPPAAGR